MSTYVELYRQNQRKVGKLRSFLKRHETPLSEDLFFITRVLNKFNFSLSDSIKRLNEIIEWRNANYVDEKFQRFLDAPSLGAICVCGDAILVRVSHLRFDADWICCFEFIRSLMQRKFTRITLILDAQGFDIRNADFGSLRALYSTARNYPDSIECVVVLGVAWYLKTTWQYVGASLTSKKLIFADLEELVSHVDVASLPFEYGGGDESFDELVRSARLKGMLGMRRGNSDDLLNEIHTSNSDDDEEFWDCEEPEEAEKQLDKRSKLWNLMKFAYSWLIRNRSLVALSLVLTWMLWKRNRRRQLVH